MYSKNTDLGIKYFTLRNMSISLKLSFRNIFSEILESIPKKAFLLNRISKMLLANGNSNFKNLMLILDCDSVTDFSYEKSVDSVNISFAFRMLPCGDCASGIFTSTISK